MRNLDRFGPMPPWCAAPFAALLDALPRDASVIDWSISASYCIVSLRANTAGSAVIVVEFPPEGGDWRVTVDQGKAQRMNAAEVQALLCEI